MPQYVILADHEPDTCPSSNTKVRARAEEGLGQLLPKLSQEVHVSFRAGPLHLDPGHRTISMVEAPDIETVTQLVYDVGLSQWNTVQVFPATPVNELMDRMENFPALFD